MHISKKLAIGAAVLLMAIPTFVVGVQAANRAEEIIGGSVYQAEEEVTIKDAVENDLFVAGGSVEVVETVADNAFVAGGEVLIDGDIEGDLFVAGGYVVINGDVAGDIRAGAGEIFINSENIGGSVLVGAGDLSISEATVIAGELEYDAENVDTSYTNLVVDLDDSSYDGEYSWEGSWQIGFGATVFFTLFSAFWTLIFAYIVLKLFPTFSEKSIRTIGESFLASVGTGIATMIVGGFVFIFLLFTLIGIPLALFLLFFGVLALMLGAAYVRYFIGREILKRFGRVETGRFLPLLLGVLVVDVVLALLASVAYVDILVALTTFILMAVGFGAIVLNKFRAYTT